MTKLKHWKVAIKNNVLNKRKKFFFRTVWHYVFILKGTFNKMLIVSRRKCVYLMHHFISRRIFTDFNGCTIIIIYLNHLVSTTYCAYVREEWLCINAMANDDGRRWLLNCTMCNRLNSNAKIFHLLLYFFCLVFFFLQITLYLCV